MNNYLFRANNEASFNMYSQLFMYLDSSMLIVELFQYELREISLALMKWFILNKHILKCDSKNKE